MRIHVGELIWGLSMPFAALVACLIAVVVARMGRPRPQAQPTAYERHRLAYEQTGDIDELLAMIEHANE